MKDVFVAQEHWDGVWENIQFDVAAPDDAVRLWIEGHFSGQGGACLELGCFPGRYLAVFGELGFELHGVDLTPRVESHLPAWLRRQGYRVGEICRDDVFTHVYSRQYDVVCSFGLIEHFREWPRLLEVHSRLVAPGGHLMVATPNFRGWVQQLLHRSLDAENLGQHNLAAMIPRQWADVVRPLGFEVLECGHFGVFDFWVGTQPRSFVAEKAAKAAGKLHRHLRPLTRHLPVGVPAYSPYCGLIAKRTSA